MRYLLLLVASSRTSGRAGRVCGSNNNNMWYGVLSIIVITVKIRRWRKTIGTMAWHWHWVHHCHLRPSAIKSVARQKNRKILWRRMNRRCTDEFNTRGSGIDLAGAPSPLGMCGDQTDEFASEYLQTLTTMSVCLSVGGYHEHEPA